MQGLSYANVLQQRLPVVILIPQKLLCKSVQRYNLDGIYYEMRKINQTHGIRERGPRPDFRWRGSL